MSTNRFDMISDGHTAASPVSLLYISTAKYGGDWHSVPHTHHCAELFYVVSGSGRFQIEDEFFPVAADDMIIVNPQIRHTETSLNASPLEYIVLGVEGLELAAGEDSSERSYMVNFRDSGSQIQFYLRHMLREIEEKPPGYEAVCQSLLNVLMISLRRQTDFSAKLVPAGRQVSKESALVRRYIDSHFKERLSLDLLAQVAHSNKYHIAHSFTRDYGISPINYLLSLRLRESCDLLQTTDHSLAEIAQITGFSSPSYFSQSFRKAKGMSPAQYRKKFRNLGVSQCPANEEETP